MEPDDAADLLGEMPEADRIEILEAMDDEEATPLRRLLTYAKGTAGGLMTSDPLVLPGTASVADALAVLRDPDLEVALAAQVFVVDPPTSTPTGRYLGTVGFQRLLREAPWVLLSPVPRRGARDPLARHRPTTRSRDGWRRTTSSRSPVCDEAHRLIGAVTVDDVLDHMLPSTWRRVRRGRARMMPRFSRRRRRPVDAAPGRLSLGVHYDPEAFGRFSEAIARTLGTARFLVLQTVIVAVWILVNVDLRHLRFDEYPFILLTLALSLQAAYARAADPARAEPAGRP